MTTVEFGCHKQLCGVSLQQVKITTIQETSTYFYLVILITRLCRQETLAPLMVSQRDTFAVFELHGQPNNHGVDVQLARGRECRNKSSPTMAVRSFFFKKDIKTHLLSR